MKVIAQYLAIQTNVITRRGSVVSELIKKALEIEPFNTYCAIGDMKSQITKLEKDKAELVEVLGKIRSLSRTPDKAHLDISISDVIDMDNALQKIFEIALKATVGAER